ncbi:hypothetical protein SAMN05444714_2635 [Yoonia litorea]|uniref:Uncharacterized protein n=1 Tax=Yoonia litorea TaxID=1123755 RepID=A0A1I6MXL1_9RHOB|nr:hypothetical protein SAMN05444714_2635 [Yoonia litorea]
MTVQSDDRTVIRGKMVFIILSQILPRRRRPVLAIPADAACYSLMCAENPR